MHTVLILRYGMYMHNYYVHVYVGLYGYVCMYMCVYLYYVICLCMLGLGDCVNFNITIIVIKTSQFSVIFDL